MTNEIITTNTVKLEEQVQVFSHLKNVAKVMATASLVPKYLNGKDADCFIIAQQAWRWGMDPFAVAQCTSVVHGKLCFEGKLVAAVVETLAGVALSYSYTGDGESKSATISGQRKGDSEPSTLTIFYKDVKTDNQQWKTNIEQMLAYRGARDWARRYTPAAMLGIYTDDEVMGINESRGVKDVTPKQNDELMKAVENKVNGVVSENEYRTDALSKIIKGEQPDLLNKEQ